MKMFCTRVLLLVWFAAGGALGVCESEEAEVNGCINTKPNTGCAGCVIATFNGLTSSLCQSIEDEMCNAITTACDCSPYFYSCILNVESSCTIDCNLPPPPTGAPPPTSAPLHEDKNCFSGASTVELENGDLVALYHVQVGDRIKVDADTNKYESIYGLGHHDESSFGDYLKIGWAAGFFLEISPEHMLLVSSKAGHDTLGAFQMIPASMVQVGDKIKVEGQPVPVSSISKTHSQGLYAPLTYSGTIVVNGVQASQYISVQNHKHLMIGSLAVNLNYQWLTHTFLFPVRAVAPLMNDTSWMQSWMLGLIDFVHYMFSLPTSILLPIAVIVLFTMSIMWIVESAMLMATGSPFMALSFMVAALLIHHKLNVSVGLTNKIKAKLA